MRDIRRLPKQPAQRANSKTPRQHNLSQPPSQKTAQLQYSTAKVKVIKRGRQQRHSRHNPYTYSLEGKQKSRKTGI